MVSWERGHFYLEKPEAVSEATPTAPQKAEAVFASDQTGEAMIAFFDLDLKRFAQGASDCTWPRPSYCGRCGHDKVWGHGLVLTIFEGLAKAVRLRRYRCPACGCIIRLRPKGYFSRHQSAVAVIRATVTTRLGTGHWPKDCATSRARHWLRALKRHAQAVLGVPALTDLIGAFDRLIALGRVPVSRAI
jgi:hypothetical protein